MSFVGRGDAVHYSLIIDDVSTVSSGRDHTTSIHETNQTGSRQDLENTYQVDESRRVWKRTG